LPYGSGSVIEAVVRSLARCPIGEVLVVAGHQASAVAEALRAVPGARCPVPGGTGTAPSPAGHRAPGTGHASAASLRIVVNERYREGMLTSVQCGVAAASPETDWFLVALVDQPAIDPAVVTRLIETAQAARERIVIPTFEGRRGHPLLFRADLAPEVLTLSGAIGLRELLQRHPDETLHVPVASDTVVRDMDTPEDYQHELGRLGRRESG
jgi:molybdenum cofactor cytidylyltransferase